MAMHDAADAQSPTTDAVELVADYTSTGSLALVTGQIDRFVTSRLRKKLGVGDAVEELLLLGGPCDAHDHRLWPLVAEVASVFERRRDGRVRATAEEEERHRLGRELHDSLAQSVYGLVLMADAARMLLGQERIERARGQLAKLSAAAHETLGQMRVQVFELHPSVLTRHGLEGAIRARLAAVEEHAGTRTSFRTDEGCRPLAEVEEHVYGIVRELLNNTLKHARAQHVAVGLRQSSSRLRLSVSDDGAGFVLEEGKAKGGLGLSGIAWRALKLGARMSFDTSPGHGTRVDLTVPLGPGSSLPFSEEASGA